MSRIITRRAAVAGLAAASAVPLARRARADPATLEDAANLAFYSFPYLFIFTTVALDVVSSEMEDVASILGSGTLRITLPMVLPAILGGAS
jgi:hypothetical protein